MSSRPTCATSPPTSCATASCCPTTRSARASRPTTCSTASWRPSRSRRATTSGAGRPPREHPRRTARSGWPAGSRADALVARRGARPGRGAPRRGPAAGRPARRRRGQRHRARPAARVPGRRRRAPDRRRGDRAHRRAARARARARAHAHHVAGRRRVAVDGVRDRAAAEVRRGRGRRARHRAPRDPPRRPRGARHLRLVPHAAASAARQPPGAHRPAPHARRGRRRRRPQRARRAGQGPRAGRSGVEPAGLRGGGVGLPRARQLDRRHGLPAHAPLRARRRGARPARGRAARRRPARANRPGDRRADRDRLEQPPPARALRGRRAPRPRPHRRRAAPAARRPRGAVDRSRLAVRPGPDDAMTPLAISFETPVALVGLALIPMVLLLQRALRRHLPAALALLAMAMLIFALAKPNRTIAVPAEQASVVLVTDHSRSMMATDVSPTRLEAARDAALRFLQKVPGPVRVGAVAYSDAPDAVQSPTTQRDDVRRIINGLVADGSTATGDALAAALEGISRDRKNGRRPPAAIVLLSDGKTTTGRDPVQVARQAGRAKVPIFTVALGTPGATIPNPYPYASPLPVPPDPVTLRRIASESKGRAYTVEDAGELSTIYQRLGSSIGTRKRQQEITAVFAIGGVLLLAGAAAASLRWSGRLP